MATRSNIIIEKLNKDNVKYYKGVYCHWDGYPEHNGKILMENYKDRERVEELINLGDMSSLGKYISPEEAGKTPEEHSYDHPLKDVTVYYGRDRGEENMKPFELNELDAYLAESWTEYVYIYTLNNEWICFVNGNKSNWHTLEEVLEQGEEILD
jgi:hypothetical protein